uniref:Uncharacterized protein n=1 Tax=Anguilla anguilla TaxID=7936 RepID=A0A0E9RL04_ANGAN
MRTVTFVGVSFLVESFQIALVAKRLMFS